MSTEAEKRGKRVKIARNMTGLSRQEFFKKTGISASTVQSWEDGKAGGLTVKGANNLVKNFAKLGIYTTVEFLYNGNGLRPTFTEVNNELNKQRALATDYQKALDILVNIKE